MWEMMNICVIKHNIIIEDVHDYNLVDQGGSFTTNWLSRSPGQ
jgi:hypothetical protein